MTVDATLVVKSVNAERRINVAPATTAWGTTGATSNGVELVQSRSDDQHEILVVVDSAIWSHHIAHWRWSRSSEPSASGDEWLEIDFDDATWAPTPHLHAVHDAGFDGAVQFRTTFELPRELNGQPITFILGGHDHEDWERYTVWVNGRLVAEFPGRRAGGGITTLEPSSDMYDSLKFGGDNVLTVLGERLDRHNFSVPAREQEHLFFQGWLLDQCILAGQVPILAIDDFQIVTTHQVDEAHATVTARSTSTGLEAAVSYAVDDDLLTKQITLTNPTKTDFVVLDVLVDSICNAEFSFNGGGRGQPIFAASMFCGVEHPAFVGLTPDRGLAELWQWPGVRLTPGDRYETARAVLCGSGDGSPQQRFRSYVWNLRQRVRHRISIYSPLGWYDFTNPADRRPELTEQLAFENLDQLADLQDDGITFDVYMFDDWWEPSDLGQFRNRTFPQGHAEVTSRVRQLGMKVGLWVAPSRALWTARELAGVQSSLANDMASESVRYDAGEGWTWDDEFAGLFLREERYCLASEPFGSHFTSGLCRLAADVQLAVLKIDGAITHCTSSRHEHMPGRWSVEPCVNRLLLAVDQIRAVRPDVVVIWYWAARSPWFLGHGDLLFDKGLKMEAATPSSTPALLARDSGNLNIDQAVSTAAHIPLALQDSLGVWLGDVAWCNNMGSAGWRDAFVLDEARGSTVIQLWGDVALLDPHDRRFLANELTRVRNSGPDYLTTERCGGSPWHAEPYGYQRRTANHDTTTTIINPSMEVREHLGTRLRGFEVRRISNDGFDYRNSDRASVSQRWPIELTAHSTAGSMEWSGRASARLPGVTDQDELAVVVRVARRGVWFYHPDLADLLSVTLRIAGRHGEPFAVAALRRTPHVRARNGPGSPWMVWHVKAGSSWTDRPVEAELRGSLPDEVVPEADLVLLSNPQTG
jgi:hypothetical protein